MAKKKIDNRKGLVPISEDTKNRFMGWAKGRGFTIDEGINALLDAIADRAFDSLLNPKTKMSVDDTTQAEDNTE